MDEGKGEGGGVRRPTPPRGGMQSDAKRVTSRRRGDNAAAPLLRERQGLRHAAPWLRGCGGKWPRMSQDRKPGRRTG